MTDYEQRVAIVKACPRITCYRVLEDLNVMHEVEKTLSIQQTPHYVAILSDLCGSAGPRAIAWPYITATARQRAEAFLRTINKWENFNP